MRTKCSEREGGLQTNHALPHRSVDPTQGSSMQSNARMCLQQPLPLCAAAHLHGAGHDDGMGGARVPWEGPKRLPQGCLLGVAGAKLTALHRLLWDDSKLHLACTLPCGLVLQSYMVSHIEQCSAAGGSVKQLAAERAWSLQEPPTLQSVLRARQADARP